MHITLVGGGWDPEYRQSVYGPFVEQVSRRSAEPAVAVVLVDESGESAEVGARFTAVVKSLGDVQTRVIGVPVGQLLEVAALEGCAGLIVGGGLTPAYADALAPVAEELRQWLVSNDVPVSYTHLRAHETVLDLVCRLLLYKTKHSTIYSDCRQLQHTNYQKSATIDTVTYTVVGG